jgi:hypothetical protein
LTSLGSTAYTPNNTGFGGCVSVDSDSPNERQTLTRRGERRCPSFGMGVFARGPFACYTAGMLPPTRRPAPASFAERLRAFRYLPPLLRLVWETSPPLTVASVLLRLTKSLAPLGALIEPRIAPEAGALPAPRPIREGFEFQDVSFAYPGSGRAVLRRVSFPPVRTHKKFRSGVSKLLTRSCALCQLHCEVTNLTVVIA